MPLARSRYVNDELPGAFHVISRCVRRAFLCGEDAEHRREWIRDLIHQASGAFAIDVLAYAVMTNHLHIVVRTDPQLVIEWSAEEVASRWAAAHPRMDALGVPVPWAAQDIANKAGDAAWVEIARLRLRSLSWFMKCIKERLARRANLDDHCTGHFWEGRFRSVPLLDQAAVLAAMAYVDLNPVRASMAELPENSDFTSIQDRCRVRQAYRASQCVPSLADAHHAPAKHAEHGLWIAPIQRATFAHWSDAPGFCAITLDEYIELVDTTGRLIRAGKSGHLPAHLAPILDRLNIDPNNWTHVMAHGGHLSTGSLGSAQARIAEALRRGLHWLIDRTAGLYQPSPRPA